MPNRITSLAGVQHLDIEALRHICANLREWDERECMATQFGDDRENLVRSALYTPDTAWLAWDGLIPVATIGATPLWPGVWGMWCFGTDRFRRVGGLLTKHVKRFMIPMLLGAAHRAEAKVLDGHEESQRWLTSFGLTREATHPGYGRNGETFHTYVRLEPRNVPTVESAGGRRERGERDHPAVERAGPG